MSNHTPARADFVPQFETCPVHARYPLNMQDEHGQIRWYGGGCPKCLRQANAQRLLQASNIPKRFADCDFANYHAHTAAQERVLERCRSYARDFATLRESGTCLLLCGRPGTGKNHLASAISKQLLREGFCVLRVKASQYLDAYWGKAFDERQSWLASLCAVDLLVLDEVGRSSHAKGAQDAFFALIDARYEAQLPSILTTNLNRDELIATLGAASYDRLTQGGSLRLTFDWDSFRASASTSTSTSTSTSASTTSNPAPTSADTIPTLERSPQATTPSTPKPPTTAPSTPTPIYHSIGQCLHVSYLMEVLPVGTRSAMQILMETHMKANHIWQAPTATSHSPIQFGGLTPLEIRAQSAMVRAAVIHHLMPIEASAVQAHYGYQSTKAQGVQALADYAAPRLTSTHINKEAALALAWGLFATPKQRQGLSLRDIAAHYAISKSTAHRDQQAILNLMRDLLGRALHTLDERLRDRGVVG